MDKQQQSRDPAAYAQNELPPELAAIAQTYAAQPIPCPTPEDTDRLLMRLLAEETVVALTATGRAFSLRCLVRVARWRLQLLGPRFWGASFLLLLLWTLLVPALGPSVAVKLLILLLPLTVVLGLAHVLRTPAHGLRELEASCYIGPVETMAALAIAIVGFDVLLGTVATAELALLRWTSFAALLAAWLAPLLCLTSLALPIALRWGARAGALSGSLPWLVLAVIAVLNPAIPPARILVAPQAPFSLALHYALAACGGLVLLGFLRCGSTWRPLPSLHLHT